MNDTNQLIEPQRYRPDWWQDFRSIVTAYMASDDDGAYVKYEDYAAQQTEIQRCHERLEITHVWKANTESDTPEDEDFPLVKVDIPPNERLTAIDGIACRDATIDLLEGQVSAQQKRIEELENRLIWAADRCDAWAQESLDWGWSTHQVKPNKELADDLRRAALAGKGGADAS